MSATPESLQVLGLPSAWTEFDETPILFANRFLAQHQPSEFILTLGQVTGPPLTGTPEEIREHAAERQLPIGTVARVGLTRHRVIELIAVLQSELDEHDRELGEH
jgi:hypothetical protein